MEDTNTTPLAPSARLEYLYQYWPRHSEMYSTLCFEPIQGIFSSQIALRKMKKFGACAGHW